MHDAIVSNLLKVKVTGSHYQRNKTLAQQNYEKFKESLHTKLKMVLIKDVFEEREWKS